MGAALLLSFLAAGEGSMAVLPLQARRRVFLRSTIRLRPGDHAGSWLHRRRPTQRERTGRRERQRSQPRDGEG